MSALLLALLLAAPRPAPDAGSPAPVTATAPSDAEPTVYGGVELSALAFPSGPSGGQEDGFAALHPVLGVQVGAGFLLELGPTLRARLLDLPPAQASRDLWGVLRREDWDSRSDLGQLLQVLRVGEAASPVRLKAGALLRQSLGLGHLVARYSNRDDPDEHPAGAVLAADLGPVHLDVLASDVLAARVFAAEVALDVGALVSRSTDVQDRFVLALSAAHDAARGAFPTDAAVPARDFTAQQQVTLAHLDASAVLVRNGSLRLLVLAGAGGRSAVAMGAPLGLGLVAGVAADTQGKDLALSGRLELRGHQGGFAYGYFGPRYELARFASRGFSGPPLAAVGAPTAGSLALDVRAAKGTALALDAQVECFAADTWAVDLAGTTTQLSERLVAGLHLTWTRSPLASRTHLDVEARFRFLPSLYAVATGGTVFFPQADGTLARGWTASLGAGVDFAR